MSDAQKTPLSRTLPSFATAQALNEIQKRGAALPGHVVAVNGALVTVNFDIDVSPPIHNVTMPVAMGQYVRLPIQAGDKGVAISCDAYLGGISGLGGGTADLTQRGNLSTLLWVPVSNANWSSVGESLVLTDATGATVLSIGPTGFSASFSGHTFTINSSGIYLDGTLWATHDHS
ncbi:MAG: hypothetical protein ACYDAE_27625, partial [Steroidobacteraceae bacterium]